MNLVSEELNGNDLHQLLELITPDASNEAPMVLLPIGCYPLEQPAQKLPCKESPNQYGESYDLPTDTAHEA
jgi:hypothetical protein